MAILATLLAFVTPVCPSWCALPAGHDGGPGSYDPVSGDHFIGHERPVAAGIGAWSVDLARDDVQPAAGPAEVGPPIVLLNGDVLRPLSTAEARELAAALVRAADIAEAALSGYGRHAVDSPTIALPARARTAGAA